MKAILFFSMLLIFSCEKDPCRLCKTTLIEEGKAPVITLETVCEEIIQEGHFITADSLGKLTTKMVTCK